MPEKRKTRTSGTRVGPQRTTVQTTLKDLFQRTNSSLTQDLEREHTDPVAPLQPVDTPALAQLACGSEKPQDLRLDHADPVIPPLDTPIPTVSAVCSFEKLQRPQPEHVDTVTPLGTPIPTISAACGSKSPQILEPQHTCPPLQTADPSIVTQSSFETTNSATCSSTQCSHDGEPENTAVAPQPSKPSQLFPIFTRVSTARKRNCGTVTSVGDIDIIDISSDTESYLSPGSPLTQLSDSTQVTSHSLPASPIAIDDLGCEDGTSPPHTIPREQISFRSTRIMGSSRRTLGVGEVAPFPSSCSQHVRGLQRSFTVGQTLSKRIFPRLRTSDEGEPGFRASWRDGATPSTLSFRMSRLTPHQCEEHLHSLRDEFAVSHPAFARISVHQDKIPETWTRRFRPRRADEVLGNEGHAVYLRDWLNALALRLQDRPPDGTTGRGKEKGKSKRPPRGMKRPRVIRAVAKRRNKRRRVDSDDDLNDFVVWSDEEEEAEEPLEDSEDDLTFCQRTLDRLRGRDTADTDESHAELDGTGTAANHAVSRSQGPVHANFADKLTNTMLITGPPGCGKTAAVYACAEELGWDVFEVYPGIGKRNGASLEQLVGDVGKNHIVQTVRRWGPTEKGRKGRVGLDGYVARGYSKSEGSGTQGEPIEIDDGERAELLPPCGRRVVGQSLVLLEEVDILFKDDAGFWPAVIEFIRSCQRPVVMTCNDAGLVPVGELPLQSNLVFEPCPSSIAGSYLECLALAEGMHVPHEDLVGLYESTQCVDGVDVPDAPLYPRTEPLPLADLRRSIMQLQILCAGTSEGGEDEEAGHDRRSGRAISADEWVEMKSAREVVSHAEAQVRSVGMGEVVGDEEAGYVVLRREEEMSRGVHELTGPMEASIREAFRARVAYQTRTVEALQGILGPGGAMVPQTSVFLDYVPWVRYMDAVEDGQRGGGGGGRRTRNSMGVRGETRRGVMEEYYLKW